MVVLLDEVKLYLKVDGDEEDTLITSFILSAEEICESILRFPLTDFDKLPQTIKQAILYAVGNMHEEHEKIEIKIIWDVMSRLLSPYRKESW